MRQKCWFRSLLCALAVMAGVILEQKATAQKQQTVNIELQSNDEPTLIVGQGQTVHWYTDADSSTPVMGIVFAISPCKEPSGHASTESQGLCQISAALANKYHYYFCNDLINPPSSDALGNYKCNGNKSLSGYLKVVSAPFSGDLNLVPTKLGHIHNLIHPGDTLNWYDPETNPQQVKIDSMTPSICGLGQTSNVSTCVIPNDMADTDFCYECADGSCTDPTAHVRSVGQLNFDDVLFKKLEVRIWQMLLAAFAVASGFGVMIWRRRRR